MTTIVDSDSCVRADGAFLLSALDSALGYTGTAETRTWLAELGLEGDWSISGNKALCGGVGAAHVVCPSSPEEVGDADQFVQCRVYTNYIGPMLMWSVAGEYSLRRNDAACALVLNNAGSYSTIAIGTRTVTDSTILCLARVQSTGVLYALVDGVLDFSITDSTLTTGRMGVYSSGLGGAFNDFVFGLGIPAAALGGGGGGSLDLVNRHSLARAQMRASLRGISNG